MAQQRLTSPQRRQHLFATLLATLSTLAGLGAGIIVTAPTASAGSTGPISNHYDLRASEKDANGSFQIAIGEPATFTAWVNNNGQTAQSQAVTFGSIVKYLDQPGGTFYPSTNSEIYLKVSYGWSPQCSTLGPGDPPTDDGCENLIGPSPYPTVSNATASSKSWTVTTKEPAPAGTETLFYDFQLYGLSSPGATPDLLLQAAAGAILLNTAPPTVSIDALNPLTNSPYPTNSFSVPSGTSLDIQTCVTTDNCQIGTLDESNFLSDDEYICMEPQGNYVGPQGNPVGPQWYGGSATQVLTWPHVSFTPPQGQNWDFKFYGFVSQDTGLAKKPYPVSCPPPSGVYMTSVNGQKFINPLPVLEVTWKGPLFVPPTVALTASTTDTTPGTPVTLDATYNNPDGAGYLYICARSGTSWLQFDSDQQSPYLLEAALPLSGQVGSASITTSSQGTAQFIAFLSDTAPGTFQTCPQTSAAGTYGTRYNGDWSNYVNVTWATPPQVSLTATYGGQPPNSAPSQDVKAGQLVDLQGDATNLVSLPQGEGYYLYICTPTTPLPSSTPSTSSPWLYTGAAPPYADTGTPVSPPSGTDFGTPQGAGTSAAFVAFVSTDGTYPADSGNTCPTAPSGAPGTPANVLAVSNEITLTWAAATAPQTTGGQWYPD